MRTVEAVLEGTWPLLMNPMSEEKLLEIRSKNYKPKARDLSLQREAEEKIYRKGRTMGIPVDNLLSCLNEAGRNFKFQGKKSISTAETSLIPAFIEFHSDFVPFVGNPKWVVDIRAGRNKDGSANCIVRPKFPNWSVKVTFSFDDKQGVALETLEQLFAWAGRAIGLGSFRKKNFFGRFRVKSWKASPARGKKRQGK